MSTALTGIRPTGELTVGNVIGAIQPMVELQDTFEGDVNVFVADMHGLTDQEPEVVNRSRLDTARTFMAAGVDPEKTTLYLQSQVGRPTVELATLLDRHITPAELRRVPTLKDKLRPGQSEDQVNMSLFRYPILMAADIMVAEADHVPVGADQVAHLEVARLLARRFNRDYGRGETILVEPDIAIVEGIKIAALRGGGKMSKSEPSTALLLTDKPDVVANKIRRAETTTEPGAMPETLASHFMVAERLATTDDQRAAVAAVKAEHLAGKAVMGAFKGLLTDITNEYLGGFQERFNGLSDAEVKRVLIEGGERASVKAEGVLDRVYRALGLMSSKFLYE